MMPPSEPPSSLIMLNRRSKAPSKTTIFCISCERPRAPYFKYYNYECNNNKIENFPAENLLHGHITSKLNYVQPYKLRSMQFNETENFKLYSCMNRFASKCQKEINN